MNASLKHVPKSHRGAAGRQIRGLRQIESKISDLQKQHQHLLTQRQQDIASLITSLNLAHIDDQILIGGLMFLKDKITTQDPLAENWRDAGGRFLRRTKPQKHSPSAPPATPHPTHQSSYKAPQSREK